MNAAHWMLRRGGYWLDFDPIPRVAYYKFLRAVYGMTAWQAWQRCAGMPS